jgi:hypothetical protein
VQTVTTAGDFAPNSAFKNFTKVLANSDKPFLRRFNTCKSPPTFPLLVEVTIIVRFQIFWHFSFRERCLVFAQV